MSRAYTNTGLERLGVVAHSFYLSGRDGRSSIGTVLDDRDGGDTPDRTGRLSMASGFGSASKFAFQNDDGYAEEQLAPLDQQQQDESFSNPDLGEPTAEYDDFGGGGEEEEGGRIPWEDKGKGRASELFREEEGDDEDDDQPVGEQFSDGSEAGAAFDDHGEEQQWSDEQEVQACDALLTSLHARRQLTPPIPMQRCPLRDAQDPLARQSRSEP